MVFATEQHGRFSGNSRTFPASRELPMNQDCTGGVLQREIQRPQPNAVVENLRDQVFTLGPPTDLLVQFHVGSTANCQEFQPTDQAGMQFRGGGLVEMGQPRRRMVRETSHPIEIWQGRRRKGRIRRKPAGGCRGGMHPGGLQDQNVDFDNHNRRLHKSGESRDAAFARSPRSLDWTQRSAGSETTVWTGACTRRPRRTCRTTV